MRQKPALRQNVSMAAMKASQRFVSAARRSRTAMSCLSLTLAFYASGARAGTIETEHLFGYTIGSDVGEVGERELEGTLTGRFSKRTGTYNAGTGTMSLEFVPLPNLRTEFTGVVNSFDIAGVTGFADQRYTAFGGFSARLTG